MSGKNSIKQYVENSYYHLYNRGVEKRIIFQDRQDYSVFLSYLKSYLLPKDIEGLQKKLLDLNISSIERDKVLKLIRLNNFSEEIKLICYCLMPNHFHFLINQISATSIDGFMNSLMTRYVMYFNNKYKRVGPLFQGQYKAVLVVTEEQLLYLTCYIHRNPIKLNLPGNPLEVQPSSYLEFLQRRNTEWVKPDDIFSFFSKENPRLSYRSFVEQTQDFTTIEGLMIDESK